MLKYDPFSAEMHADPFETYARLREEAPLYHNDDIGFWAFSRYEDVVFVSRNWEIFTYTDGCDIDRQGDMFNDDGDFLDADPPKHTILRAVVQPHFRPKELAAQLEQTVQEKVDELISGFIENGSADLAEDLAWPLPASVSCALLGLPREDEQMLGSAARIMALRQADRQTLPHLSIRAHQDIEAYIHEELKRVWTQPKEGLLSKIAHSEIDGKRITESTALGMAVIIFAASIETTASHVSTALMLLAQHPDQRRALAEDPTAVPKAVEEALRMESPIQVFNRKTTQDFERYGIRIPKGERVFIIYASANRDERVYENSEQFDVFRESHRHLAFGEGIHHCLGAPLSRMEGRIAIETILKRLPEYEISGPIERFPSHGVRGLLSLPVEFEPSLVAA